MSALRTRLVSRILFPLHERLKGHDTVRLRRELERSQWWSAEGLQALQFERLRHLLAEVAAQVPWYRELFRSRGLAAGDFRTEDELACLPVTDKALIRAEGARWRSETATGLIEQRTSGSSGEPLHFALGRQRVAMDVAAKWRAMRWWGVDIGDPELVVWGSSIEQSAQSRARALRDRLFRSRLVPGAALDDAGLDAVLDEMRSFRPKMLFGYPSVLARLAWRARQRGLPPGAFGVTVAFTTAEVLQPQWRRIIAEAFGCGVANEYGARDAGFIARECPAGGWHITAEEMIVEILDESGNRVPPGETGDIVVTNLCGPEFPFIRYRTGDRGALAPGVCACGRALPRLSTVSGRANDALIGDGGARVHGSVFNYLMRDAPGLRAYRIEQSARDRIEVAVVFDGHQPPEGFTPALERIARRYLGAGVRVELRVVTHIPPEPNGKFRHVICRIGDEPFAATAQRPEIRT